MTFNSTWRHPRSLRDDDNSAFVPEDGGPSPRPGLTADVAGGGAGSGCVAAGPDAPEGKVEGKAASGEGRPSQGGKGTSRGGRIRDLTRIGEPERRCIGRRLGLAGRLDHAEEGTGSGTGRGRLIGSLAGGGAGSGGIGPRAGLAGSLSVEEAVSGGIDPRPGGTRGVAGDGLRNGEPRGAGERALIGDLSGSEAENETGRKAGDLAGGQAGLEAGEQAGLEASGGIERGVTRAAARGGLIRERAGREARNGAGRGASRGRLMGDLPGSEIGSQPGSGAARGGGLIGDVLVARKSGRRKREERPHGSRKSDERILQGSGSLHGCRMLGWRWRGGAGASVVGVALGTTAAAMGLLGLLQCCAGELNWVNLLLLFSPCK